MMKIIKANKDRLKNITFLMDLITPVIMILSMGDRNQVLNSAIFLAMVMIRLLFIIA